MFTIKEKVAFGIAAVETIAFGGIGYLFKKYIDNQYLESYNMTAKEYFDVVMTSKSVDEYNQRINR